MPINFTLKTWALPWLILLLITIVGLFLIGEGNFPWALAGEVKALEAKIEQLEELPETRQPPFQLPGVQPQQERTAQALRSLEEARVEAGLIFGEVRPEPALSEGKLMKTPFSLTAQGTVESLVAFLYLMERDYPSMLIERMRIGASGDGLQVEIKVIDRALIMEARENG